MALNEVPLPLDLDHPLVVSRFNHAIRRVVEDRGFEEVVLHVKSVDGRHFPNATAPMAATIDFYRRQGVEFLLHIDGVAVGDGDRDRFWLGFLHPRRAEEAAAESDVFSRVWRFSEVTASDLAEWIVTRAQERLPFSPGVFEAFNWALWEVMDNVLQHSGEETGFIEAQVHPASRHLAVCVSDSGQGILSSFRGSRIRPASEIDALTLAIREGVTRDSVTNQGNGLWGLSSIVQANSGSLRLTSGRSWLSIDGDNTATDNRVWAPHSLCAGTTVDFQLKVDRPINLPAVLGHNPVTGAVERFMTTESSSRVRVLDHAHGTGTRRAAEALRTLVTNQMTAAGGRIDLDFDGVAVISSSFADELVGKLVVEIGFMRFMRDVQLSNVNPVVSALVDRAVRLRLANSHLPETD